MHKITNDNVEELFKNYQGLLRKASAQNHLHPISEEAYAQAALSFYEAVQSFDKTLGVPFAGYVKAKVYGDLHTLFKKHRRNWQRELSANDDQGTENIILSIADKTSVENDVINKTFLHNALQTLPLRQQQIIDYTVLQGYTQVETAKLLQISQQAVASSKKSALKHLKTILR